jgi:hypothetical protein
MSGPSGAGFLPSTGMRLTELSVQVGNLCLKYGYLPAQLSELDSSLIPPGRFCAPQFSPELGNLPCQLIEAGGSFGNSIRRGTDKHSLARMPDHQLICLQLRNRGPHHRYGDAIPLAQLRGRRNSRSDRQVTGGDLPTEVVGDLLVSRTPDSSGHPAILLHRLPARTLLRQPRLTTRPQSQHLIHKAVHSVLSCCAPLGTPLDAYAPARITGELSSALFRGAEGGLMQQVSSASRRPDSTFSPARARHLANQRHVEAAPAKTPPSTPAGAAPPVRRRTHHVLSRPGTQP